MTIVMHVPVEVLVSLVNIAVAKAQLSMLVDRVAAGEEIILAKAGRPVARLVAVAESAPRRPGTARHWIVDDAALLEPTSPEDLDAADDVTAGEPLGSTAG